MRTGTIVNVVLSILVCVFLVTPRHFEFLLAPLTRHGEPAIYVQNSLMALTINHLALVACATIAATIMAVSLGILATRPGCRDLLPLARAVANAGQTFPPVAVLALSVPVFGFGAVPTFIALFLYGLLPILENTLAGLEELDPAVIGAGRGMGMTTMQLLLQVELPLAMPVILSGIRLSAVISLATATIGSTVAASTLGEVIVAGLLAGNTAYVLQGGLIVAILAVLINSAFLYLGEALPAAKVHKT